MAIISRRFRWLEILFPPAEANPPNPNVVSGDIVFTHDVLSGTESLDEANSQFVNGAAGVLVVNSSSPAAGRFFYVIACALNHDDTGNNRQAFISIQDGGTFAGILTSFSLGPERQFAVGRAFILPAGMTVRWQIEAISGTKRLQGSMIFLDLPLGAPTPRV